MSNSKKIIVPIVVAAMSLFCSSSTSFFTSKKLGSNTTVLAAATNEHNHSSDGFSSVEQSSFDSGTYSGGQITGGSNEDQSVKLYLNENITSDITISSGYVAICLNGKTLTGTGSSSVITVSTGAYLTLCDCQSEQGEVTNGGTISNGGGVYVDGGSFTLSGGIITGNTVSSNGGGVFVSGGSFEMTGGTISYNEAIFGGGVYVDGDGFFEMSGGTIEYNEASQYGGGIFVNSGTFKMNDGTIDNNTAQYSGGGIYVFSGSFELVDGTISNNEASRLYGGGVYISTSVAFTMSGGIIDGNTAGSFGGGVFVSGGTFTMSEGTISNNKASQYGGGIYVSGSGTFTMEGGTINNNSADTSGTGVYVADGGAIEVRDGSVDGTIQSTETGFITGGVFDEDAYETIEAAGYLADGYVIVMYSDDNSYGDNDYNPSYPYVLYQEVTLAEPITINTTDLSIDCDEAVEYSPSVQVQNIPNDYQQYGDVEYSYLDTDNQTVVEGLPREAGNWTIYATIKIIDSSTRSYYEQTAEFSVNIAAHVYSETQIENEVDVICTANGSYDEVVYCTVCENEISRNIVVVASTGHNYSIAHYDESGHWYECEVCETLTDVEEHNYSEEWTFTNLVVEPRVCDDCGAEETMYLWIVLLSGGGLVLLLLIVLLICLKKRKKEIERSN